MRSMLENGGTLRPNARTLWEIQEKAMRPPAETAANLYMEICARAKEALGQPGVEELRAQADAIEKGGGS